MIFSIETPKVSLFRQNFALFMLSCSVLRALGVTVLTVTWRVLYKDSTFASSYVKSLCFVVLMELQNLAIRTTPLVMAKVMAKVMVKVMAIVSRKFRMHVTM